MNSSNRRRRERYRNRRAVPTLSDEAIRRLTSEHSPSAARWLLDRTCRGKRMFSTKAAAKRARKLCIRKNRAFLKVRVYRCPYCRQWHLGHRTKEDRDGP